MSNIESPGTSGGGQQRLDLALSSPKSAGYIARHHRLPQQNRHKADRMQTGRSIIIEVCVKRPAPEDAAVFPSFALGKESQVTTDT
jgi:hypothetical protein